MSPRKVTVKPPRDLSAPAWRWANDGAPTRDAMEEVIASFLAEKISDVHGGYIVIPPTGPVQRITVSVELSPARSVKRCPVCKGRFGASCDGCDGIGFVEVDE